MSDDTDSALMRDITDACHRRGLQISNVERQGAVVVLHPKADAELPDAAVLRELAGDIDDSRVRYVTLGIDGFQQFDDSKD